MESDVQSNVEQGYLVLADISGFTPFVAESELDHSQAILSEILNSNMTLRWKMP